MVMLECFFSWQARATFGDVGMGLFVVRATFGDVAVSLLVAEAAFGVFFARSLFVADGAYGDIGM